VSQHQSRYWEREKGMKEVVAEGRDTREKLVTTNHPLPTYCGRVLFPHPLLSLAGPTVS